MSAVALAAEPACAIHPHYVRAEALEQEIVELCAHLNAATYRLLELIGELDEQEPWAVWGLKSCAHWLNWRCGIGLVAAREKVRVAHALKSLPGISAVFRRGEVSYSKVRALTRVATSVNEAELVDIANHSTAAQLERICAQPCRRSPHVGCTRPCSGGRRLRRDRVWLGEPLRRPKL